MFPKKSVVIKDYITTAEGTKLEREDKGNREEVPESYCGSFQLTTKVVLAENTPQKTNKTNPPSFVKLCPFLGSQRHLDRRNNYWKGF